ncbi:MAG: EAL domain-containing protein [Colwellia sp.]|nr:EAL domain-containing protein [Colwellia sp.]
MWKTKPFFLLIILTFFVSLSVRAEQSSLSITHSIIPFVLGISLSILVYLIFYFFIGKKKQPQDYIISQDELFNYTHDLTTNLPTAQHALKQFEQALKNKKHRSMAAIVFKPINFQQVNTVLGHHNSDILLLQLAYCLQKSVADNQSLLSFDRSPEPVRLARLQGLDFLVVFDLSTSKHEARHVIDDLCQHLANAVPDAMSFKSFSLNFELAFGIAMSDKHGNSVNEIVSHATDALLECESKKQTIQYFDNSAVLYTEQQLVLMECLRQDIIAENLRWYLQPQVNVDDNSIIGFELKVHWYSDDKEPLELADFISLAEHSGEVYRLTKQMFKHAFKTLFALHKMGVDQKVSVSLSSENLLEPDLVDFIEQQMKNFNISGKYLMIDLNEQVILSACQRAKATIDQLKSLDITIAISNFSGSYESLRYLRKMAIHQVKINCHQLGRSDNNSVDKAIINALITLTRSMKIPLIGTHIDKHETVNDFIAMGGVLVQGDIINRGVVLDEIEIWLKRWFTQHPTAKPFNPH